MNDQTQVEEPVLHAPSRPNDVLPEQLYILPLPERPFFPAQAMPLMYGEAPWLETFQRLYESNQQMVGLVLADIEADQPIHAEQFKTVGTVVRIHKVNREGGHIQFLAQGLRRFRVQRWLSQQQPFLACVEYLDEAQGEANSEENRAYAMAIINTIKDLVPLNPLYSEEVKFYLSRFHANEPGPLADFAASLTSADRLELQDILETFPIGERLRKVLLLLKKELSIAQLQANLREQVQEQVNEQQRKFFLREQLKAIQRELGIAKDDRTADVERFSQRLQKLNMPQATRQKIDEELNKLSVLESGSPEYAVTRNYLDVITSLPWGIHSKDKLDLKRARRILDRGHTGLDDVKQRILEFLAVSTLKGEVSGSILLLVGPPGVGKTSIGRSIADALGRKFHRLSLGGMRDEAEIKGHRRTYIGAMPGRIIAALREAGTANPVIMLDEVDKLASSYQGDPGAALLEVLDPEQNSDFLDHYLDTRFDLSKVLFIATANQLDTIPEALLDRMQTIRLSGYLTQEKTQIAKQHLWPRLLKRAGIDRRRLSITDEAIERIADGYAREAGVRNLEKQLGRIVSKAALQLVEKPRQRLRVDQDDVEAYLGKPVFRKESLADLDVGCVTGLAWTPMGGATLTIEAARIHSRQRGFQLTGKLGQVMQESANIAYSYIAANLKQFGAIESYFDRAMIHLHVPEGATPKDGPSAGITMATALLSLALSERIARPLAMTGELTLSGHVLPVGGIREKVTAARRLGIPELILPQANQGDFEELPDYLKEDLQVHFVARYAEVAALVFSDKQVAAQRIHGKFADQSG